MSPLPPSVMLTMTKSTPEYFLYMASNPGISCLHGGRRLAQKFNTIGFLPVREKKFIGFPPASSALKSGAVSFLFFCIIYGRCFFDDICLIFFAQVLVRTKAPAKSAMSMTRIPISFVVVS